MDKKGLYIDCLCLIPEDAASFKENLKLDKVNYFVLRKD